MPLPLNTTAIHEKVIERLEARGLGQPFITNDKWARMISGVLRAKDLRGANLQGAKLSLWGQGLDLHGVDLSRANLRGADLSGVNLREANLTGADLTGARLNSPGRGVSVEPPSGTNLQYANLRGAKLDGANIEGADLRGAVLTKASLVGAKLFGANLGRVDLTGADLTEADLKQAFLADAHLSKAKLNRADLEEATLSSAKLISAKLVEANLTNADFSRATLTFADLRGAETEGANLDDANGLTMAKQGSKPTTKQTRQNPTKPVLFWADSEDVDDLDGDPWKIAQSAGVRVLSNKEFRAGYQVKGKVVAALFDDPSDPDEYSFDIAVSPQFQKLGLGGKLLDVALGLYAEQKEARGDDYKMRLNVINPAMERMLERKGFVRVGQDRGITIMERSNGRQGR